MTEMPEDSRGFPPTTLADAQGFWRPPPQKTSGFAIASVVLGSIGLVSCCFILPSLLGMVFGFVALSVIRRGEAAGRGLALTGLTLSIIGLLVGIGFWVAIAVSPDNTPIAGTQVTETQRKTLRDMKVLEPDESIDTFCATGKFAIREGGVLITDRRLVVYSSSGPVQAFQLNDIERIDYTPAANWLEDGHFAVTREDGESMTFIIDGMSKGDRTFHRALERRVARLRAEAGKPPPRTDTATATAPEDEEP